MGWIWQDDDNEDQKKKKKDNSSQETNDLYTYSTTCKVSCNTEEVEPGKFVRKCHKKEEVLKSYFGRPAEVVKSNSEYTEQDVTNEMTKGGRLSLPSSSSGEEPFNFPGLQSDIDAIAKNLFGGMNKLFEAAEELGNGFFGVFGAPFEGPSVGNDPVPFSRRVPVEGPSEGHGYVPFRRRVPVEGPSEGSRSRKQKSEEVALSEFGSQVEDV